MDTYKTIIEIISALLIVVAFELLNRKSVKGYSIMAVGQFLAMAICIVSSLWFLAATHLVNSVLMVRGYLKWKNEK